MDFADDNERPRPADDLMGGWDIGYKGGPNDAGTAPGRWSTRAGPEIEVRSVSYSDLYYPPSNLAARHIIQAVGRYEPPKPVEMVRDLLTGETYKFSRLIDDGYVIGVDEAGDEYVIGLLNWERFSHSI